MIPIKQSIVVNFNGNFRIPIPECVGKNLKIHKDDFLLIEFKDNSIIISPVDISKKQSDGINE